MIVYGPVDNKPGHCVMLMSIFDPPSLYNSEYTESARVAWQSIGVTIKQSRHRRLKHGAAPPIETPTLRSVAEVKNVLAHALS